MHPIVECMEKDSRLVVGLMSGTSADGVDAALCRITGHGTASKIEQLGFVFQPFSGEIRRKFCGWQAETTPARRISAK